MNTCVAGVVNDENSDKGGKSIKSKFVGDNVNDLTELSESPLSSGCIFNMSTVSASAHKHTPDK